LYKDELGFPNIKINKIQLGYKYSLTDLASIKEIVFMYYYNINNKLNNKFDIPEIKISPLTELIT
jgi:hypothetical protein